MLIDAMAMDVNNLGVTDITSSEDFLLSTNVFEYNLNTFAINVDDSICQPFDPLVFAINVDDSFYENGELSGYTFDANSFKLYAYGQADPLNLTWWPENQYFNVSGFTPPQYYTIEISYMLLCPYIDSRFSFGLYELTYGYTYDNDSGTDIYGEVYELIWKLDTSSGSNDTGNVRIEFMAHSGE